MYGVTDNIQTHMSALVFSPSLQDTWTQWVWMRVCVCVCVCEWETEKVHWGWQLRVHVWTGCGWLTQWWCGQSDPGCHAHTCTQKHTYMQTHSHTKLPAPGVLPTVTPGSNIIISPPGWFGGIRGLQREREGEKKAWFDPLLPGNVAELGEIIFWNATDIVRSPSHSPLFPSPIDQLQLRSYLASQLGQVFIALFIIQVASWLCGPQGKKIGISMIHKPPLTPFPTPAHFL